MHVFKQGRAAIWLLLLLPCDQHVSGFSSRLLINVGSRFSANNEPPSLQRQPMQRRTPDDVFSPSLSMIKAPSQNNFKRKYWNQQQQQYKIYRLAALSLSPSSVLGSSDTWGNWMVLTGAATVAQRLGATTRVGRLLGAPVSAMALTFVMASTGILPAGGTPASKSLQALSIQLATPLVLLGADFTNCLKRCGPLIISFIIASFGTMLGCYVGWKLFGNWLSQSMLSDGLKIAAALLAKNIGGGINYVAVCRTLHASPASMAAGLCVDNLMALLYFPLSTAMGAGRPDIKPSSANGATTTALDRNMATSTNGSSGNAISIDNSSSSSSSPNSSLGTVQQITTVVSLSALLLWLGERLGGMDASLPCCTFLTVILANVASRWIQPLRHTAELLGTTCLYWFFATAGAPGLAVAESVQASLLPLGLYLVALYGIHAACLFLSYQLVRPRPRNPNRGSRLDSGWRGFAGPQRLLVASSAAIGGPATAVALAQTHGWTQLQVPSILVGNLGYAIATFCGLAFHQILLAATSA